MPDDLYDRDFLIWSERQADLLRRLAVGERVNESLDFPNLIEEVESLGRGELRSCASLLRHAMIHVLKLKSDASAPAAHWRSEIRAFLIDARDAFTPAMAQRLDLEREYRRALLLVSETDSVNFPGACPWSLDDLLAENADLDRLLTKLQQPTP